MNTEGLLHAWLSTKVAGPRVPGAGPVLGDRAPGRPSEAHHNIVTSSESLALSNPKAGPRGPGAGPDLGGPYMQS